MNKTLCYLGLSLGVLGVFSAVALFVAAIWTDGPGDSPLSDHLGCTGLVALFTSVVVIAVSGIALEEASHR